jgi:putative membrane protein
MDSPLPNNRPSPVLQPNDKKAAIIIWTVSIIVFIAVALLTKVKLELNLSFNPHIFATFNAIINSIVALLLLAALLAVKSKKFLLHKKLMVVAIILSLFFLVSYICHHLLSGDTKYGDLNHDGILSVDEKSLAGNMRYIYYFILATHIPLAGIILPFILFTAYRALTGDYSKHMKLARITWPIWFYVAITGVVVYLMIRPYYN